MSATKIIMSGLTGQVGTALLRATACRSDIEIVAGFSRRKAGTIIEEQGIKCAPLADVRWYPYDATGLIGRDFQDIDVVVDFSHPEQCELICKFAVAIGKPLIIGTLGLTIPQILDLRYSTNFIPIFYSGNPFLRLDPADPTYCHSLTACILDLTGMMVRQPVRCGKFYTIADW